jgi:hypothetical protein
MMSARFVVFTRQLPYETTSIAVNPDLVCWIQKSKGDDITTLFMENGPEVEVLMSFDNAVTLLRGGDA